MDRFRAYLLVRQFLRRPESRGRARATEALMEALAERLDEPVELWATLGLLSLLDVEATEHNPDARGRMARSQAELEGLEPALAEALERWVVAAPEELSRVDHALVLASHLCRELPPPAGLARELALNAGAGDAGGDRLDAALSALSLSPEEAAALAHAALGALAERRP